MITMSSVDEYKRRYDEVVDHLKYNNDEINDYFCECDCTICGPYAEISCGCDEYCGVNHLETVSYEEQRKVFYEEYNLNKRRRFKYSIKYILNAIKQSHVIIYL